MIDANLGHDQARVPDADTASGSLDAIRRVVRPHQDGAGRLELPPIVDVQRPLCWHDVRKRLRRVERTTTQQELPIDDVDGAVLSESCLGRLPAGGLFRVHLKIDQHPVRR